MAQVPHYLLIGKGRVSYHFQHYFSLLSLSYEMWHRGQPLNQLYDKIHIATHILLLINDDVIQTFYAKYLKETSALSIHFSGSLVSDSIYGAHPLMSFCSTHYSLEQYQSIPFIIDHDAPLFDHLLPGLSNSHVRLHKLKKAKYHALCVLSGNFSCMLWQKFFESLEQEFDIPSAIGVPYLFQQTQNLLNHYPSALTGPLVRQDEKTMENNLRALSGDPFKNIYQSFIDCYQQLRGNIK